MLGNREESLTKVFLVSLLFQYEPNIFCKIHTQISIPFFLTKRVYNCQLWRGESFPSSSHKLLAKKATCKMKACRFRKEEWGINAHEGREQGRCKQSLGSQEWMSLCRKGGGVKCCKEGNALIQVELIIIFRQETIDQAKRMDFYYNQQYISQFLQPYPYYLPYYSTYPAHSYLDSTFAPVPLMELPLTSQVHTNTPSQSNYLPLPAKKQASSSSSSRAKSFHACKDSVTQKSSSDIIDEDHKKAVQKESRNVLSNLLRILFKNIIEVHMYDGLIERTIAANHFKTDPEEFYRWLESYSVNYKNYIRFASVKKIMISRKRRDHLTILRVIIQDYVKVEAISHCLTSKRIDRRSVVMHLKGLRQLKKELLQA